MASTLTPTLINDDFQNWLKGALAVLFAKEGLIGLVGNEIIDFQRHLLQTLYTQKGIPPGTTCSSCTTANVLACPTAGFCSKGKKCKAHDSKVPDKKPNIACPNGVCFHIRDAIINEHRFKSPSWKNTDARKWCFDAFELSKCFMPPDGYFYKTSLEDTDFNGILAVVINNKRFQSKLSVDLGLETNICLKARNIGREIRYTTNHLLRAQDLMKYIDDLVALLSDPAILATDVHSKTAVGKLKQLKTNTLTINADDITNVLNENIKETIEDQQIAVLHDIQEHVNKIKRDSVEEIDRKIKESVDKMLADKLLKGLPPEILRMDKKSIEIYKQALAEGLPPEIKRMDEKSIELYKQALAEGSMPDYDVRVMIVGHSDVGKTTLKKRLFDETVDIMERKSTHGIKVHVGNCKVNRTSGEWIVQEEDGRRETLYQRLAELLRRNYQPSNPTTDTGENKEHDGTHESSFLSGLEANSSSSTEAQSPSHSVEPHMSGGNELDNKGDSSDRRDKEMCLSDLNEILRHSSKLDTIQETSELCIWDFAGQSDFYAMHQVFLSHRAVYLLVTKLTEHIDDDVDDQRLIDCTGKKYRKIGDLIEFWLNSIYEYVGNDDSHDQIPQNVILVGTHADQITEDFRKYSTSNFFGTVRMSLADKVTFNLLTEKGFLLNNVLRSTDPSSTISDIRKYILETASKQSYWGKPIPAKWCNLEKILMELRKEGTKILKVSDVVDLNKALPVPLDSDEIDLFLRVHHERGNILFYRNDHQLQENIILDPQWLIDAFKSIMTSCSFCCTKQNLAKKWAEFEQTAVLQSQLIEFIWKQEGYSEFRQHSTLILCFMEKLGLIAKPYQSAMPEETQTTVDYFVPYFLKIKPPEEILNTKGNKAKYSSKLCITTKSGFLPNTIFNKLLAACIQNFKPSGPPGRKHIYCGCGVFDVGTNCHQMFVCFADHVIHIWFSRLSSHENPDNLECKKISDFILNILRQDLKEDVIFYKCWKASVESKVKLFQENLPQNNEVICYCQNDGHSVKYSEITQYWQKYLTNSKGCTRY